MHFFILKTFYGKYIRIYSYVLGYVCGLANSPKSIDLQLSNKKDKKNLVTMYLCDENDFNIKAMYNLIK